MEPLDILARSVRITVGDKAEPRPGQAALCVQVSNALENYDNASAIGPVGSGKSFALLAAAAARCVDADERVLVSTESLSLQKQILDKDAPTVIRATEELGGRTLKVAVLKGTGNYVDPRRLTSTAALVTDIEDRRRPIAEWMKAVHNAKYRSDVDDALDGADFDKLKSLLLWSFSQYDKPDAPGDRHSCTLPVTDAEWTLVSAQSAEATGPDDHWLLPKAVAAKERVFEADIVIVNHTLLAIQAATGIPIVTGNRNYGVFHHILVDEAHALPDEVRTQGASEVSGRAIHQLMRAVRKVSDAASSWERDGEVLADALEADLRRRLGRGSNLRVSKDDDPLGDLGIAVANWARRAGRMVKPAADSPDVRTMLAARRAQSRIDELCAAVSSVSEHHAGEARWVEAAPEGGKFRSWASAQSSPVDVSSKLQRNLWTREDEESGEQIALGVACVSATLPPGFPFQAGLRAQTVEYPSPFVQAYGNSALLIPSGASDEARRELLTNTQWGTKFDTKLHTAWAARRIVELVRANEGSALILSATASAGRVYADEVRRAFPDLTVLSQWDGGTPASLLHQWREDHSAVLIGTRSLMTGVDAPGETCTLVVLDRIPRKPSNPIDDARVEEIVARGAIDKWGADRMVYAADAALREAQAIGRLIRSGSDSGMVAVLDPRLLKYPKKAFPSYPEPTRAVYMKPLYVFEGRFTDVDEAAAWLIDRKRTAPSA